MSVYQYSIIPLVSVYLTEFKVDYLNDVLLSILGKADNLKEITASALGRKKTLAEKESHSQDIA